MKSILKRIVIVLAILMLLFSINSKVFAWSDIIESGQSFIGAAKPDKYANINASGGEGSLQDLSGYLYNILLGAGVVIAVIVAGILGIQFIIGGAEGQAKVKEMLLPFVVGCIVVFGGFAIWKVAIEIGQRVETVGTYQRNDEGNPVCANCGDVLSSGEQRRGECSNCGARTGI